MAIHPLRDDVADPAEESFLWPPETDSYDDPDPWFLEADHHDDADPWGPESSSTSRPVRLAIGGLAAFALLAIAAALLFGRDDDDGGIETVANASESTADEPEPTSTTAPPATSITSAPTAAVSLLPALPVPSANGGTYVERDADGTLIEGTDAGVIVDSDSDADTDDDPAAPSASSTTSTTATPATTAAPTTAAPAPVSCNNPWPDLEGCGWPGPDNTGPRSGNCPNGLTANGSSTTGKVTITQANAVLSCQRFSGTVEIKARNVTIRDSTVTVDGQGRNGGGGIVVNDGGTATIEYVEIDGLGRTHACIWHQGEGVTVNAMECKGMVDGMVAWARTEYSPTAGDNFTLRNSYLHSFTHDASNGHIDGFQTLGATNGVIERNVFDLPASGNAAVAIWNTRKNASNIRVTGNLMTGGQFTVYAQDNHPSTTGSGGYTVTNITFTNNRFSTRADVCVGDWGPWYYDAGLSYNGGPTDGWSRSGNVIVETGRNVDGGNHTCR